MLSTTGAPDAEECSGTIAGYRVVERISEPWRSFVVVRALDGFGRTVALKLPPETAVDPEVLRARLGNEAECLRRMGGRRGVVRGVAWIGSHPALVTEFIDGESLATRLGRWQWVGAPLESLWRTFFQLADAVASCHAGGVVHRDVKPSNVLFTTHGSLRLIDFDVALRLGQSTGVPRRSGRVGTLPYCAPELIERPWTAGPTADIYSLGVVLFELLTGRLPYERVGDETDSAMAARMLDTRPTPPCEYRVMSTAVQTVVLTALRRRPADRFPTVRAFADALRRVGVAADLSTSPQGCIVALRAPHPHP